MNRRRLPALAVALPCAALLAAPAARANHLEAKVYVITDWPSGTCSANDIPSWDDMAFAWYDEIGDGPVFYKDGSWTNGGLCPLRLLRPGQPQSPCSDDSDIDDADAALVAFHGSDNGKHWSGALRVQTRLRLQRSTGPRARPRTPCSWATWTWSSCTSRPATAWTTTT